MWTASAKTLLICARPSVNVRWRPPLAVAIVTHLVTRLRAGFGLATWMQTTGATLVSQGQAVQPGAYVDACPGHRSAYGLLYLAAVRGDWREHEDRGHRLANTLSKSVGPCSSWVVAVCDLRGAAKSGQVNPSGHS